jgi:hypothetical protein
MRDIVPMIAHDIVRMYVFVLCNRLVLLQPCLKSMQARHLIGGVPPCRFTNSQTASVLLPLPGMSYEIPAGVFGPSACRLQQTQAVCKC